MISAAAGAEGAAAIDIFIWPASAEVGRNRYVTDSDAP